MNRFPVFCISLLSAAACAAADPVLLESFDDPEPSPLAQRLLAHRHLDLAPGEGVGGSNALRATYRGGEMGSERIVVRFPLGERGPEYTLSYDVRFAPDFRFVRGGKLHGLGPDRPITGGNPMRPDGWSARLTFGREGRVSTYLYVQNKTGRFGHVDRNPDFRFEPGRYHSVSIHVRLNDPANAANGFAHIYVDGEPIIGSEGMQFRADDGPETLISQFLFSTFHGGNAPEWAPRDADGNVLTVHAWFDNLAIHRGLHIRPARAAD